MVHHFVITAKLRVLVLDRVEAMRAGGDDYTVFWFQARSSIAVSVVPVALVGEGETIAIQRLDILLGHHLPQVFIANTPRRIARAPLLGAENGEVDPCSEQNLCNRGSNLLIALVE